MGLVNEDERLERHSAIEAAAAIAEGRITSRELVEACLASIDRQEDAIGAWAWLDRKHALLQADLADRAHREGRPHGPLHGVPVGIKDIIDTHDMPTERGTILHAGRTPRHDATVVARLRQAGAIIMGKTVTTEFAVYQPGKTAHPHDPSRTPGGSSSGSAAAVAAGMVPLAVGTQTNGSVIRPAAYCGVVGFKPSFGLISRHGVMRESRALDHVGVFARAVEDAALIAECLTGFDPEDTDTHATASPPLLAAARSAPPVKPRLAFVRSPVWDQADAETKAAFAELVDALGDHIEVFDLPPVFNDAIAAHRAIMETDLAVSLAAEYARGADCISPVLRGMIERGQREYRSYDYARALELAGRLNGALDDAFSVYDAFVTPATTGVAPPIDTTGSPVFCSIWTLCGTPAVTLPLMQGESGLPIGVQLVGARGNDARLLRTANWLAGLDFD